MIRLAINPAPPVMNTRLPVVPHVAIDSVLRFSVNRGVGMNSVRQTSKPPIATLKLSLFESKPEIEGRHIPIHYITDAYNPFMTHTFIPVRNDRHMMPVTLVMGLPIPGCSEPHRGQPARPSLPHNRITDLRNHRTAHRGLRRVRLGIEGNVIGKNLYARMTILSMKFWAGNGTNGRRAEHGTGIQPSSR